jgi:hypothetical protein
MWYILTTATRTTVDVFWVNLTKATPKLNTTARTKRKLDEIIKMNRTDDNDNTAINCACWRLLVEFIQRPSSSNDRRIHIHTYIHTFIFHFAFLSAENCFCHCNIGYIFACTFFIIEHSIQMWCGMSSVIYA